MLNQGKRHPKYMLNIFDSVYTCAMQEDKVAIQALFERKVYTQLHVGIYTPISLLAKNGQDRAVDFDWWQSQFFSNFCIFDCQCLVQSLAFDPLGDE